MGTSNLMMGQQVISIPTGTKFSSTFVIEKWVQSMVLVTPTTLTAADIGLQASFDSGSNWGTVVDFATQADAKLLTSGATQAKIVSFGALVQGVAAQNVPNINDNKYLFRITSSVNQAAERFFVIFTRSGMCR